MLHITFELCAGKRENACVPGPKIPVCLRPKTPVCLRPKTAYRAAPDTAAAPRNRSLEAHPTRTETLACPARSNRSASPPTYHFSVPLTALIRYLTLYII